MNGEQVLDLEKRAAIHAALGDPARLRIVDILMVGDISPSELADALGMASNLVAHHLKVLESAGVISRHRSEGDGRRTYLRLSHDCLDRLGAEVGTAPDRVVFVCTANSARSHLAAALWRRSSPVPVASAGTHPADRIDPGAIDVAERHRLPLPRVRPRHLDEVVADGDLIVTVCDLAREELGRASQLHWSVPDPSRRGTSRAFDAAYGELATRVTELARRLPSAS
jgi:protein-tyrosine-phosphatase